MKIALVRFRPFARGGAETTLRYLLRGFVDRGHEVRVFGAGAGPQSAESSLPGARYVPVPVWGGKAARLLSFAVNCRKALRQADADVVLSLERTLYQQVYRAGDGCHREWLRRREPFLSPLEKLGQRLRLFHRVMLYLELRVFTDPGLRLVIANSRQVREEIQHHYGVAPDKIRVIFNGLDRERYQPLAGPDREALARRLGAPKGARVVLFVGSGFRRKGLVWLIEAFAGVSDPQAQLWVVGHDSSWRYPELAARLGVGGRVKFWGSQADTAPFYQAATVLALPTIYDPCSNVVLEALGCGTPVITTAANGAAEFLTSGVNGTVIAQPDDVRALTQALEEFLELGQGYRTREAAATAVAHLSWENTVQQSLEVLEEAVQETR